MLVPAQIAPAKVLSLPEKLVSAVEQAEGWGLAQLSSQPKEEAMVPRAQRHPHRQRLRQSHHPHPATAQEPVPPLAMVLWQEARQCSEPAPSDR